MRRPRRWCTFSHRPLHTPRSYRRSRAKALRCSSRSPWPRAKPKRRACSRGSQASERVSACATTTCTCRPWRRPSISPAREPSEKSSPPTCTGAPRHWRDRWKIRPVGPIACPVGCSMRWPRTLSTCSRPFSGTSPLSAPGWRTVGRTPASSGPVSRVDAARVRSPSDSTASRPPRASTSAAAA